MSQDRNSQSGKHILADCIVLCSCHIFEEFYMTVCVRGPEISPFAILLTDSWVESIVSMFLCGSQSFDIPVVLCYYRLITSFPVVHTDIDI
jgi:hypothetical protein